MWWQIYLTTHNSDCTVSALIDTGGTIEHILPLRFENLEYDQSLNTIRIQNRNDWKVFTAPLFAHYLGIVGQSKYIKVEEYDCQCKDTIIAFQIFHEI